MKRGISMGDSIRHMGGSIRHMGTTMSSGLVEVASYASGGTGGGAVGPSFTILPQGQEKDSSRSWIRSGGEFGTNLTLLPKLAVSKDGGSGGGGGGGGGSKSAVGGDRLGFPNIQTSGSDAKMNAKCEGGEVLRAGEAASNRGVSFMNSGGSGCDGEGRPTAGCGS